jgi:hypothetical protein
LPYSGDEIHPIPKPAAEFKLLVEAFAQSGDVVLGPFCGSGSMLVAARILSRRYLGIELDAQYYAVASKRLHPDDIFLVSGSLHAAYPAVVKSPAAGRRVSRQVRRRSPDIPESELRRSRPLGDPLGTLLTVLYGA